MAWPICRDATKEPRLESLGWLESVGVAATNRPSIGGKIFAAPTFAQAQHGVWKYETSDKHQLNHKVTI